MSRIDTTTPTFYQDTSKLKQLKGREGLEAAASEFEAMFLQMVLKNMRSATEAIADDNSPFSSQQQQFYQQMADGQLASDMAKRGSMGLADALVQQLGGHTGTESPEPLKNSGAVVASPSVNSAAFQQPLNRPHDKET
ncbi:rod-binding protein [Marinobacter xestospongiae]|uniref:Rod-binding protein n=1 Tax=Marinobacter xestospongiae TaxID=994319 RepID=A0ABU3VWI9_9GAMM|nr:rod-binding protein [Marinobacter xestospongiae]MDV2078644.1 rod-binding protein [Marinobacter xestospongiae]